MRNWTWKTWVLGGLAFLPGGLLAALIAVPSVRAMAFVGWIGMGLLAILVFGIHLMRHYRQESTEVGTLIGYGLAFVAGPAMNIVPFPEALPGMLGWVVTSCAFPVYWYRIIKPVGGIPEI